MVDIGLKFSRDKEGNYDLGGKAVIRADASCTSRT